MKKFTLTLLSATLGLAVCTSAISAPLSKDEYKAAKQDAATKYDADKATCKPMTGNAKDICIEEAKGREKVAKAEAEENYQSSAKHRYDLRLARAEATYNVAKEKCDDQAGNAKDVCRKEAKAAYVSAKADANVAEKTAETTANARQKTTEVRLDAAADKRDAAYAVAKQKCDALAGDMKDNCVKDAKNTYQQN